MLTRALRVILSGILTYYDRNKIWPLIGKIQDKKNNAIYNCAGIVQHMFDLVKKANQTQMVTLTIKNNYIMSA